MAFKLKSGNKPKFKEIGSSPFKAISSGLADAEYHYNPDVPSDVILGEEDAVDEEPIIVSPETKKEEEEGVVEETTRTLPAGTGEEYKNRKQRRIQCQAEGMV